MRAVNLLPREPKRSGKRLTTFAQVALVSPLVVVSLLVAGYLLTSSKVNDKKSTLQALQDELAALPAPTPQPQVDPELALQRNARVSALSAALQGRLAWDRILRQISAVLPGDVWLTTLAAQSPQAAAPAPAATTTSTTTTTGTTTTTAAPPPPPTAAPYDGRPAAPAHCRAPDSDRLHVLAGRRRSLPQPAGRRPRAAGRQARPERAVERGRSRRRLVHDPGQRPTRGDGMSKLPAPAKFGLRRRRRSTSPTSSRSHARCRTAPTFRMSCSS